MEKRYTVFISSTYEDLREEREKVMGALLKLNFIPCGMELFPASSEEQWSLIQRVIDDCDYYILILAGKYGSVNNQGISYTEMEYRYAIKQGKPVIAFVHKCPDTLPANKVECSGKKQKQLENFRKFVKTKLVNFWQNPYELGLQVSISMTKLIAQFPTPGWVKADHIVDQKNIMGLSAVHKYRQYENKVLNDSTMLEKLDICAFGLRSFRDSTAKETRNACANGLVIRFLCISPSSIYLEQREKEENVGKGEIARTINDCIEYFLDLKKDFPQNVFVKSYDSLPLDLYWRQDDILAVGPYLFGKTSQQTITYEYKKGTAGFSYYTDYFEELWNNNEFCTEISVIEA